MILSSTAVRNGRLDERYGINGSKDDQSYDIPLISFPLEWSDVPAGTKSFALSLIDYDNCADEGLIWIHWLALIPGDYRSLKENASRIDPHLIQGYNSWACRWEDCGDIPIEYARYYGGPAPEREHEYELVLYALDYEPDLNGGFYYNDLRRAMRGHLLDKAELKAFYG